MMQRSQNQPQTAPLTPCGTPNKESRFPSTSPTSRSIKIAAVKPSAYEMQLQNYEALADYRDYVMYQRISTKRIDANLSSASATSFGLQPNNLQHLVASKQISFANTGMEDDNTHFDQEYYREEGIFEMDL